MRAVPSPIHVGDHEDPLRLLAVEMPGVAQGCWPAQGGPGVFFCFFVFPSKTHSNEKGERTKDAPSAFVSFPININTFTSKVYEHFL